MTATLKLAAVGDIMLGDHPVCFGHGVRSAARHLGLRTMMAEAIPIIQAHNIFLGNLECVLSDAGHDTQKLSSSELRGDPKFSEHLNICNHNIFCVANNHMLQHGEQAFEETCTALRNSGSDVIGHAENARSNVQIVDTDEVTVAFIGYSFRPENYSKCNNHYAQCSPEEVLVHIRSIKSNNPDYLVVLSVHWGEEYLHAPSGSQIDLGHQFIDAGATLVLGHHPHTLQGVEEYGDGVIAYSLGNFLFDSWQQATKEIAIFSCELSKSGVLSYHMIPGHIDRNLTLRFNTQQDMAIAEKIAAYSELIQKRSGITSLTSAEYSKLAEKTYLKYRLECYIYFLLHIWKYPRRVVYDSLFRAVLRRLGIA